MRTCLKIVVPLKSALMEGLPDVVNIMTLNNDIIIVKYLIQIRMRFRFSIIIGYVNIYVFELINIV